MGNSKPMPAKSKIFTRKFWQYNSRNVKDEIFITYGYCPDTEKKQQQQFYKFLVYDVKIL